LLAPMTLAEELVPLTRANEPAARAVFVMNDRRVM
jgi:hypothetical protein